MSKVEIRNAFVPIAARRCALVISILMNQRSGLALGAPASFIAVVAKRIITSRANSFTRRGWFLSEQSRSSSPSSPSNEKTLRAYRSPIRPQRNLFMAGKDESKLRRA